MVEWRINKVPGGILLDITGHATGKPEVCAAISALAGTWSVLCQRHEGSDVQESSGDYHGYCPQDDRVVEEMATILTNCARRIEVGYPNHLVIHGQF